MEMDYPEGATPLDLDEAQGKTPSDKNNSHRMEFR